MTVNNYKIFCDNIVTSVSFVNKMRKQECRIDKIFLTIKLYSTIHVSYKELYEYTVFFFRFSCTHLA